MPTSSEAVAQVAAALSVSPTALATILAQPWRFYRIAIIPKHDGSARRLRVPCDELKAVQRALLRKFLKDIDAHPANHCRRGRSVITNAEVHLRNSFGSSYDIADCFPTTSPAMVRLALRQRDVEPDLIATITGICTLRRELPQGAPTSPALLGAVLWQLDETLTIGAARHGLQYTRYMDDLFVSGGSRVRAFERLLHRAVTRLGYQLAAEKTRHWGPSSRPTLAGVVLDTTPSPRPEYLEDVVRLVAKATRSPRAAVVKDIARLKGRVGWIGALWPRKGRELLTQLADAGL